MKKDMRTKLIACAMVLVIGIIVASIFARQIDREGRAQLLQKAKQASLLVSASDVAALSGTEADLSNPVYQTIKHTFVTFRSYDPSIRFFYMMGYRPDISKQFFYVDSEESTSSDYSPPGQVFEDTLPEDIEGFIQGATFTSGPYRDQWGEWVSGYAPIKDASGQTMAMVGIDIATSVWHRNIVFVWTTVLSIAVLLSGILWSLLGRMFRTQHSIQTLVSENQSLEHSNKTFTKLATLAQLGKIAIYFKEKTVMIDEQFKQLFGGKTALTIDEFLGAVHPEDRTAVIKAMNEAMTSTIRYTWFDARIGTAIEGYRLYYFYGDVEGMGDRADAKFSGVMQDITDIQK